MTDTPSGAAEPAEVFPPTLREVMLRPRWLAMLALCLVVAGVFAWLGQWQLARAVDTAPREEGATEQVQPIDDVVTPGAYLPEPLVGQRVSVSGTFVAGDFIVVSSRFNDNVQGFWVTGQLRRDGVAAPTSIAVALGWAATRQDADAAAAALETGLDPHAVVTVTGRLVSDEGPVAPPEADPQDLSRMSPAALLSRWHDIAGLDVYRPFLVSDATSPGLVEISSPAPQTGSGVNWLNIFYAAEWAVFAGFAFYLWYRLAKDAWEKELEELEPEGDAPRG
ncbi:SURF1 family protein [Microbacterium sp. SORGH_AS_0888]|uniref:SURF1 family protein n=1 Tax=Microbacterium sp. SORGH_AS_0888 TaxID=3041791 RepID=UPI00277E0667|nr:SURF1 family cytochrome oxidase biogenesis protein [Microbacterium sp. SORGH_AS_0888]MDQ1129234.1 surfeit locus 1 family protein [Microbacterium sp. SORGH_AS_0888]